MRKCNWFIGHCLHKVDGTECKIKRTKKKICSNENDYIYERFFGKCIDIEAVAKCCWCGKTKTIQLCDYDILTAINYPDVEGSK